MCIFMLMILSIKKYGIRIGIDGNPLEGEPKLPQGAKKAIKKLWEPIKKFYLNGGTK